MMKKNIELLNNQIKEVQIVYRLFLVSCYLLHVPRLPSQPASTEKDLRGWVIEKNWLELAWQYIAVTRNNLYIIWIALVQCNSCSWLRAASSINLPGGSVIEKV